MRQLNRITPNAPAQAYKTYTIISPTDRTVVAACEQVGCLAWRNGWDTVVDESTELGRNQAAYIRLRSGRTFRESRSGTLTAFRFEAHQRCFREHSTRPEFYGVLRGDWRLHDNQPGLARQLGGLRVHQRPEDWVEDFALNQDRVAEARQRG